MFHFQKFKRYYFIGGGMLLLPSLVFIIGRLLPPSQADIEDCTTIVEQQSYYQLEVNSKPILFFADYKDKEFSGGTTNADSIITRKVRTTAYWVNRYQLLPSCFGRLVTKRGNIPSAIINLSSSKLQALIKKEIQVADDELAGFQTQLNELSYYMRIHNVSDFGYNRVADYHKIVEERMDSLQKVIDILEKISTSAHLKVKQINRYFVKQKGTLASIPCHRVEIFDTGNMLLQTDNERTPLRVTTTIRASRAQEELAKLPPRADVMLNKPLQRGIPDSLGYYIGETKHGIPNGYGEHFGHNGSFFSGHFAEGLPNGFGFYIAPHEYLQVGEWKNGVFKGEKLSYNGERIYGIDISKHQHEKNKKRYTIDWDKLRITDLGVISSKKIEGKVDYPISFMYIKSTEGCTVLNNYYRSDYAQARQHNIKVGAYHFFSTTSSGAAQANYFLKNTLIKKGDLPPVLDVEPTDLQIQKMGGAEVMFKHVRAWLSTVHNHIGVRPILYISQMFTKKYLPLAIDIQGDYFVWIARYGEYKPEIKLTYWQLSPNGKVRGIHGDVDINVFNGYKNQYELFLKKYCIK